MVSKHRLQRGVEHSGGEKEVSSSLQCELTERKIAILRLAFLWFHQTNLMLALGRILLAMHTDDLQAIGISTCFQVCACLIIVI